MCEMYKTRTCTSNENTHSSSWPLRQTGVTPFPLNSLCAVILDATDVCHNTGQVVSKSRSLNCAF